MKLVRPVYGNNGEMLLNRGVMLTARYIMALRRLGILTVNVEGCIDEDYSDALEDEVRCDVMKTVHDWTLNRKYVNIKELTEKVEIIINEIITGKKVIGNLTEICSTDMYTYAHSVDVCVLALVVGIKLDYKKNLLLQLGIGSLLHDLGKTKVPPKILNKNGSLTPAEFREIKKHPLYGYKMLLEAKEEVDPVSALVVLDHHEKYDGSGYPRGLKGIEIGEMPTICGVADVYNAITTDRVYRNALPPHEAYEMIMASGNSMFSMEIVESFLKCIVPYPVGTVVKLSNGYVGGVHKLNSGFPLRPLIKILNSGEIINLILENDLVITQVLRPEELFK